MIYIIDDDHNVKDGFIMLIKSAGFDCGSFEGADEFLKNYRPGLNDLLILDIHLSGMDGFTLIEKIRDKGLHIPVIVVTTFDDPKNIKLCKKYGVIDYLHKPADGRALIDIVKYNLAFNSQIKIKNPRRKRTSGYDLIHFTAYYGK